VEFELPVVESGDRRVILFLTRAPDYGVIQPSVDGEPVGDPIDLWSGRGVLSSGPIELGVLELSPESVLRIDVVGTNDRSISPHHQFGIDGISLAPVD
jgi:hypothetical protein